MLLETKIETIVVCVLLNEEATAETSKIENPKYPHFFYTNNNC